jgi:hypothetical protein
MGRWYYILSHLHDPIRPAAGALSGSLNHHTFARQMLGERFAGRLAPGEAFDRGLIALGLLCSQRVFGGRGLQFFEL